MVEISSPAEHGLASLAGQLAGKFAEKAAELESRARNVRFDVEEFASIPDESPIVLNHEQTPIFPAAEMLARHPDGRAAVDLFNDARAYNCVVKIDLIVLERAIEAQLGLRHTVSINLNAETFFSKDLPLKLRELQLKYPDFNPKNICLEITEQGGIPENFDAKALIALKKMGFKLALDDFHPVKEGEEERLEKFVDHVDIIKFPYEVLEIIRDGSPQQAADLADKIEAIKNKHPDIIFVMEGYRATDTDLLPILKEIGIDRVQATSFVPPSETRAASPIPFTQVPIALARLG